MTPEDRRQVLIAAGFLCASTSFATPDGPRWFAQEPAINTEVRREKFGSHNLFIDLNTGRWCRWGINRWQSFERGPWNELAEEELETEEQSDQETGIVVGPSSALSVLPDGIDLPPIQLGFLRECLAAGFRYESELNPPGSGIVDGRDLGNRWLVRDGEKFLAFTRTHCIHGKVNGVWDEIPLSQFSSSAPAPVAVRELLKPPPRRELSAVGVLVQSSGNALQKGLF